jgi:hypothetical protein
LSSQLHDKGFVNLPKERFFTASGKFSTKKNAERFSSAESLQTVTLIKTRSQASAKGASWGKLLSRRTQSRHGAWVTTLARFAKHVPLSLDSAAVSPELDAAGILQILFYLLDYL